LACVRIADFWADESGATIASGGMEIVGICATASVETTVMMLAAARMVAAVATRAVALSGARRTRENRRTDSPSIAVSQVS
jgi:hypothetical protein